MIVMALVLSVYRVLAFDWTSVELSGVFEGVSNTKSIGSCSYSFALQRTFEQGGDLNFSLKFRSNQETIAVLEGGYFLDMGALTTPPAYVNPPRGFGSANRPNLHTSTFLVGHYFLMTQGPLLVLFQITDFSVGTRTEVARRWYGTIERATGRLSIRYVSSDKGLDDLNRILADQIPDNQTSSDSAKTSTTPPNFDQHGDNYVHPLAEDYEQFQNDAKTFLDLPSEQVTVSKCDVLLDTAKDLITRINDQIGEVDGTITSNRAQVTSLNDRLTQITDLQLKDRTQTRINKTQRETERLQEDMKKWTAKLDELQKVERILREYRLIIGI